MSPTFLLVAVVFTSRTLDCAAARVKATSTVDKCCCTTKYSEEDCLNKAYVFHADEEMCCTIKNSCRGLRYKERDDEYCAEGGSVPRPAHNKPGRSRPGARNASTKPGFYLTYEVVNQGTLFQEWSETKVSGALAFFAPAGSVPGWKKKKSEIKRSVGSSTVKAYRQGVAVFAKTAKSMNGDLVVLNAPFLLVLRESGNKVIQARPNAANSLRDIDQVAAVDKNQRRFRVMSLTRGGFTDAARGEGSEALTI